MYLKLHRFTSANFILTHINYTQIILQSLHEKYLKFWIHSLQQGIIQTYNLSFIPNFPTLTNYISEVKHRSQSCAKNSICTVQ